MTQHDSWQSLAIPVGFILYLNTDPVVELLTHYIGLYDLDRKRSCFCCLSNLLENSLNAQCIHDISHLL